MSKNKIFHVGKVGIGTAIPDQTLELFKTSGTNLVKVSTQANSTVGLEIEKTGSTTQTWRIADGQTVNGKLEFYDVTDSTTRLCIDGSGRILINRTSQHQSSSERLSVNGMTSIQLNSTSTAPLYVFNEDTTSDGTIQPFMYFSDGVGLRAGIGVQRSTGLTVLNGQFGLSFRTGSSGIGGDEKLRIQTNGKVGINTDNPQTTLYSMDEIAAGDANKRFIGMQTKVVNGIHLGEIRTTYYSGASGSYPEMRFVTHDTERLRINSNGTVHTYMTGTAPSWLGTTFACREKFSIFQGANFGEACFNVDVDNGNSFLSHNMYYSGGWKIKKSGSPVRHLEIGTNGWTFMTGAQPGSDDTVSALTKRFRINPDGKINIGTLYSTPTTYLDIRFDDTTAYSASSNHPNGLKIFNDCETDNGFAGIELAASDGDDYYGSTLLKSIATGANYSNDFAIQTRHSGTYGERLRITSDGLLYINNRAPNNSSHSGNIVAYAPASGRFAYKSLEIGSTNSSSNDTGGLIVGQRKGTSAYPFALLGSWDSGTACTVYIGGGWGTQSANATQLNFYTSGNQSSGGDSGHVRLSIDTNGEAIFYKNVAVGGGHPWAVTGSPYNNLSISGSNASSSGFLNLGNGAAATNADFDLSRIKFHNGATEVATIRATTATSDSGDAHLRFYTKKAGSGTKEVLRIRNDGFIETVYTENQQSYAHNISPTPCIRARNHYAGNGIYAGIQLFNQRSSGAAAVADIGVVNDASTDYVSYLTFTTRNSDTSYSEKIRIDSGGQIRYQYANNAKHAFALRETVRTITGHSSTGYQYVRCALLNSRTAYRCAISTQGGNYGPGVQFFTVLRSWNDTTFYVTDKLNIGSAYANAVRMQSDNSGGTFYIEVNINLTTTSQGFTFSVVPLAANSGEMTTALQFYGSGMSNLTHTSSASSL